MARHYDLLENTATLAQIEDHQKSNDVAVRQEELSQRKAVFDWLRPAGVENDHHHFTNSRRAYPETGKWLLDHDTFQEWFDPLYPMVPPLLWLNGIPGAGKYVTISGLAPL